jgi:2-desacetyl-2-hydroxyethyl bacteriochlorophyllide A dehydrogenase
LPYPLYPGYSHIGKVVAVGDGVSAADWVGKRVASTAPHASHVVMPVEKCHLVPASLSDEAAVFFNLIAIAMQATHKARIELGESVLVIGAGLIGLFAMQLAHLSGGLPVTVIDLDESRLALARQLGADEAHQPEDYAGQANVIIEATGVPSAVKSALQWAAQRGRVVLLGSARGDTDGVNFYRDVHRKGITIIGAHEVNRPSVDHAPGFWRQSDEHRIVLELLVRGRIAVQPMITHRFAWGDFSQAYDLLVEGVGMGMLINWQAD